MSAIAVEMVDMSPGIGLGEPALLSEVIKPHADAVPQSVPEHEDSDSVAGESFDFVTWFQWDAAEQSPDSLFLFSPTSPSRLWCQQLEQNVVFRWVILFSVLVQPFIVQCVCVHLGSDDSPHPV